MIFYQLLIFYTLYNESIVLKKDFYANASSEVSSTHIYYFNILHLQTGYKKIEWGPLQIQHNP
jgi:methyl coenzyme M reductase beta subunit